MITAREIAVDVINLFDALMVGRCDDESFKIHMMYLYCDAEYWRVTDAVRNIVRNESIYNADLFGVDLFSLPF